MAYTTIDNPELYFQVKTYTGNGSTNAITLDGDENMQPDMVWLKSRSYTDNHVVHDSVRGSTKRVFPNLTQAEGTESTSVTSFDSDGFTLGADGIANGGSGKTYVAWCWKESADAGFDILTYTGNATNRTISHNLSAVPQVVIVKRRDSSTAWSSLHLNGVGNTHRMVLNDTSVKEDDATFWQDTDPTSSVFSLGTSSSTNVNTGTYVAYLFSEKQGFSKFGSFEGNANAAGPFVYCGFRPAWVMIKDIDNSGNSWLISDNKRNAFNVADDRLFADLTNAENQPSDSGGIDFLSNGFAVRTNDGSTNASGTRIFMAFAEAPFVNSNGVPCNAR